MAIDFPSSPSVGDQVIGPYGEVYTWDGVAWSITAAGENGGGGGGTGDTLGAYLVSPSLGASLPLNNGYTEFTRLDLPAGTWNVWGYFRCGFENATNVRALGVYSLATSVPGQTLFASGISGLNPASTVDIVPAMQRLVLPAPNTLIFGAQTFWDTVGIGPATVAFGWLYAQEIIVMVR